MDTTQLIQSITTEIGNNLSQLHAGVLKQYIDEAEKAKVEMVSLKRQITDLTALRDQNKKELDELRSIVMDKKVLENQRQDQAAKAIELAHQEELMKVRMECEKEKTSLTVSLFNTALRNVDIVRSKLANMPVAVETIYTNGDKYSHIEQRETSVTETERRE